MFDAQGLFMELYDWILQTSPQAIANVEGGSGDEEINGVVYFFQTEMGVIVMYSVGGLPVNPQSCTGSVFAMHIHEGGSCTGAAGDPFSETGGHYNPYGCPHPYQAGDLPPLFSNGGYAFGAVLTSRFGVEEILGRTIVIHADVDDFHTQPSGNSGAKIACGVIRALEEATGGKMREETASG